MEQSTPVSTVSSELTAGQLPSNEGLRNIQQVITFMCLLPPEWVNRASCIGLLFIDTVWQINVNSVTYLLIYDMCEVLYQTWETVSLGYPNNEKGVENMMCSFDEIRGLWIANETLSWVFYISSQLKQKLWSKHWEVNSLKSMLIKTRCPNLLHGWDIVCFNLMNYLWVCDW